MQIERLLMQAVQAFDWGSIYDYDQGSYLQVPPRLDLAVIAFPQNRDPVAAHVLLSPDFPQGYAVSWDPDTWQPLGIQWQTEGGEKLSGEGDPVFRCPYPASVLKLMVGVGILRLWDQGRILLDQIWEYRGDPTEIGVRFAAYSIQEWLEQMLCLSDDRATCALIQLLHEYEMVTWDPGHPLNQVFQDLGLFTLQLNHTRPSDGSFLNRAGSGVGHIHMTAWDTVKLLWLLDPLAPKPFWGDPDHLLSQGSRRFLVEHLLGQQAFHEMLSTTILCGFEGVEDGIPSQVPARWIQADGSITLQDNQDLQCYTRQVDPCQARAEVTFAHKTGLTANYGSDVGIVRGIPPWGRHYLIALFTNLGYRYTSALQPGDPPYASGQQRLVWYPQQLPKLGSHLDRQLKGWLEEG